MQLNRQAQARKRNLAPRTAEEFVAKSERFQDTWNRVIHVIAKMRADGFSLRKAADEVGISPSTVLRWGKPPLRKQKSGRFVAKKTDRLLRVLQIPASNGVREIAVRNFPQASLLGEYSAAVQKYLSTGDSSDIEKFKGNSVTDASGNKVPFLTDPDELNRLGSAGVLSFESLYSRDFNV